MKKRRKKTPAPADIRGLIAAAKHTIQALKEKIGKRETLRKVLKESKAAIRDFEDSWRIGLLKVPAVSSDYHALKRGVDETERMLDQLYRENLEAQIVLLEHRLAELKKKDAQLGRKQRKQPMLPEKQRPKRHNNNVKQAVGAGARTAPGPRSSPQEVIRQRHAEGLTNGSFLAAWSDIEFADGEIIIRHNESACRMPIPESRAYLNDIKAYYAFKNVPRLQVVVTDGKVEVKNRYNLFYHIKFLTLAGIEFGSVRYDKQKARGWSLYNKEHYNKHLSFLFNKDTLKKLCVVCDSNWPIGYSCAL